MGKKFLGLLFIFLSFSLWAQEEVVLDELMPEAVVQELPPEDVAQEEILEAEIQDLPPETIIQEPETSESTIKELETAEELIPEAEISEELIPVADPEQKKPEHKSLSIVPDEILARPDVEKFRQQYLSPKWSALLYDYLESAMEYRLYVRKAIQDRNLPEVLEYLPVVESNYKTAAKSRSGALGMWQFMANSVKPFLELNDFVDQRLDPWYSTDAGLTKLTENYGYFKDWCLAIAAYNCGIGAMNKALRKAKVKDYWYLVDNGLLPAQTASYVPKLLAIADLAINSEYYGIDLPDHNEEFEQLENEKNGIFDYITVNKAYSINALAKELRIDEKIINKLNPSYILGMTHPTKESKIRLPIGMKQSAEEAMTKLTPYDYPFKYEVVAGDSLWSISRKYHVTVQEICELNDIKENAILRIGKILYIPSK